MGIRILGIDPGPSTSGVILLDINQHARDKIRVVRAEGKEKLEDLTFLNWPCDVVIVEDISCYGLRVGESVFGTARIIGRLQERFLFAGVAVELIKRPDVSMILARKRNAKDAELHKITREYFRWYGGGKLAYKGTKKKPGPLFEVKSHALDALSVGLAYYKRDGV